MNRRNITHAITEDFSNPANLLTICSKNKNLTKEKKTKKKHTLFKFTPFFPFSMHELVIY